MQAYMPSRCRGKAVVSRAPGAHKITAFEPGVPWTYVGRGRADTLVLVSVETIDAAERRNFLDQRDGRRVRRSGGCREAPRALLSPERAS